MCKSVAYAQKLINESCNCIFLTSAYRWKHSNYHNFSCASSLIHFLHRAVGFLQAEVGVFNFANIIRFSDLVPTALSLPAICCTEDICFFTFSARRYFPHQHRFLFLEQSDALVVAKWILFPSPVPSAVSVKTVSIASRIFTVPFPCTFCSVSEDSFYC